MSNTDAKPIVIYVKTPDEIVKAIEAITNKKEQTEHESQVIAAAPDLLAILRVLLAYLPDADDAIDPQLHAALISARTALESLKT